MRSPSKGFERAIERARLYAEAGADVLFVEAPQIARQLAAVTVRARGRCGRSSPTWSRAATRRSVSAHELGDLGFRLVIFPGGIVRALARTAQDYYGSLAQPRHQRALSRPHVRFQRRSTPLIGTPEMLALGERYESLTRRLPMSALDPVTLAVLKGRLEQIADEMDATLYRSAFNPIIAEARDACHGLYHAGDRRDARAGHQGPADLRRRHGVRGEGRDRQGRAAKAGSEPATPSCSTTPTTAARISTISASCARSSADGDAVLLARLRRPLARHRRQRAGRLQPAGDRKLPGRRALPAGEAHSGRA